MPTDTHIQLIICVLLAFIPALIWGYVFYRKNPESHYLTAITFLFGALSVFPILLYKHLWQYFPWMNAFLYTERFSDYTIYFGDLLVIPLSVFLTFMFVGIIEEWMKNVTVRVVDKNRISSIDDAITFSIIAALGFSFTENILYFYDIWLAQGLQDLILPFVFRSLFSTFAHVMFSGIFGYYYGIAYFASPILIEEMRQNRHPFLKLLHRLFHFRTVDLFHREKITEGLLFAAVLHAVFNIFLELNIAFLIVPYLAGGYFILDNLIKRKENHKIHDKIIPRPQEI